MPWDDVTSSSCSNAVVFYSSNTASTAGTNENVTGGNLSGNQANIFRFGSCGTGTSATAFFGGVTSGTFANYSMPAIVFDPVQVEALKDDWRVRWESRERKRAELKAWRLQVRMDLWAALRLRAQDCSRHRTGEAGYQGSACSPVSLALAHEEERARKV